MVARLRYNNQTGSLGTSLSSSTSGTSQVITGLFASAPGFATIASPDYLPLIIEPATSAGTPSANFEIAWLTAYTAGSTNGTILRGQEGTSAPAHSSGVIWDHGATALDVQPASMRAHASASQTIPSGGSNYATVIFDQVDYDSTGSLWSTANNYFTAPRTTHYQFIIQVKASGASPSSGVAIRLTRTNDSTQVTWGGATCRPATTWRGCSTTSSLSTLVITSASSCRAELVVGPLKSIPHRASTSVSRRSPTSRVLSSEMRT